MMTRPLHHPIITIGLSARGASDLTSRQLELITAADVLVGGKRHLAYFPNFAGETLPISGSLETLLRRLGELQTAGKRIVVLASGDPLFYGIGKQLTTHFPPDQLRFEPAPSAIQLAFAALKEPWEEAVLLSAHTGSLHDLIPRILAAPKAAILTNSSTNTPDALARALLAAGLPAETACAVCESLGGEEERLIRASLGEIATGTFAPLNVLVVWPGRCDAPKAISGPPQPHRPEEILSSPRQHHTEVRRTCPQVPGLADEAFVTHNQLITKREIRLLTLAELALAAGEVLWDIGAGSGAVGIEAARAQPLARVYALEKRANLIPIIEENLNRFPAPNYQLHQGTAPEVLAHWPDPNAVFIGGSGGQIQAIIAAVKQRLFPGGRLVINLASLETVPEALALLPGARLSHVQISLGVPLLDKTRLQPVNPVFMIIWQKDGAKE